MPKDKFESKADLKEVEKRIEKLENSIINLKRLESLPSGGDSERHQPGILRPEVAFNKIAGVQTKAQSEKIARARKILDEAVEG